MTKYLGPLMLLCAGLFIVIELKSIFGLAPMYFAAYWANAIFEGSKG